MSSAIVSDLKRTSVPDLGESHTAALLRLDRTVRPPPATGVEGARPLIAVQDPECGLIEAHPQKVQPYVVQQPARAGVPPLLTQVDLAQLTHTWRCIVVPAEAHVDESTDLAVLPADDDERLPACDRRMSRQISAWRARERPSSTCCGTSPRYAARHDST